MTNIDKFKAAVTADDFSHVRNVRLYNSIVAYRRDPRDGAIVSTGASINMHEAAEVRPWLDARGIVIQPSRW